VFSYSLFLSAYLLYRAVSPVSTIVQYNPGKALVMETFLLQSLCKVAQNQYAKFLQCANFGSFLALIRHFTQSLQFFYWLLVFIKPCFLL